jgi:molecular chaperone GrpE
MAKNPDDNSMAAWPLDGEPTERDQGGNRQGDGAGTLSDAAELEGVRRALAECEDRFLRERAENENFKKRLLREKAEDLRFATEPLVRDLLPVVDNLERALEHSSNADPSLREGVQLVLKSLLDVLERHNVKRVEAQDQLFDPTFHQAIAQVDSPAHAPGAVVQQHQVGYTLNGRLVRPAVVTVNGRKSSDRAVESGQNSD